MTSPNTSHRGTNIVEDGGLAPLALSKIFGDVEDIMEIDSPAQSLKKLLAEKAKNQTKMAAHGKKTKDLIKYPRKVTRAMESSSMHQVKFKFWLEYEAIKKFAKEQGLEEFLTDKTIANRITRGIPCKEVEGLECVSISYPRVPQILYPSERSDDIMGQHLNLTQLPQEIEINPISKLSLDFHIVIHFQLSNNPLLQNHITELVKDRLNDIKILLRTNLIESISILCMSVKRGGVKGVWADIVKLHLLNSHIDEIALLVGQRVFILHLEPH